MEPAHQQQKKLGATMIAMMWIGIFIVLGVLFSNVLDKQNNPNQSVSTNILASTLR